MVGDARGIVHMLSSGAGNRDLGGVRMLSSGGRVARLRGMLRLRGFRRSGRRAHAYRRRRTGRPARALQSGEGGSRAPQVASCLGSVV